MRRADRRRRECVDGLAQHRERGLGSPSTQGPVSASARPASRDRAVGDERGTVDDGDAHVAAAQPFVAQLPPRHARQLVRREPDRARGVDGGLDLGDVLARDERHGSGVHVATVPAVRVCRPVACPHARAFSWCGTVSRPGTWTGAGRGTDPPLSPLGEQQAAAAARTLHTCDAVFCSDLVRAACTVEIIAEAVLPGGTAAVARDPRIRERNAGEWTGLTRREIEERDPGALREGRRPSGFEPDAALSARALAALAEFAATLADAATALVVTHGGVIRSVERVLGGGGAQPLPTSRSARRGEHRPGSGGGAQPLPTSRSARRGEHRPGSGDGEPIPNLGGRRVLVEPAGLQLGESLLLLDATTEVTIPRQL